MIPIFAPGLDYSSWNGVMLIGPGGSLWGIRVGYLEDDNLVTGWTFYERALAGAYARDGEFAEVSAGPIRLTWARTDEGIIGEVQVNVSGIRVVVEAYPAHDFSLTTQDDIPHDDTYPHFANPCSFTVESPSVISGISPHLHFTAGITTLTGGYAFYDNRHFEVREDALDHFRLEVGSSATESFESNQHSACLSAMLTLGQTLLLRAQVSATPLAPFTSGWPEAAATRILQSREVYQLSRFTGEGPLAKASGAMAEELRWMRCWHPFEGSTFLPAGRKWMRDGRYNLWGWDENFNAVLAAYLGDAEVAATNVRLARGDQRIGPYALWNVYALTGNAALLETCYPAYRAIFPPDDDSLLDSTQVQVGMGMDDTPMREEWRSLGPMISLDMCCMKAWSLEILGRIAGLLGREADARQYDESHGRLLEGINATCWHEERGTYLNRYRSGEWPVTEGPTSFYPLLAGVPSPVQAQRLLQVLCDPRKFWGDFVIPSLAKDDPEYGQHSRVPHGGRIFPPHCYWRGAIWAPPNYLIYEGLKRYRFDAIAAELAEKSVKLWRDNWMHHGWSSENYDPETGARTLMAHSHQSWSMLLPLMGVKELLDIEWWDDISTLRLGTLSRGVNRVENFRLWGMTLQVATTPTGLTVMRDGQTVCEAEGNPCVLRHFPIRTLCGEMEIIAEGSATIRFPMSGRMVVVTDGVSRVLMQ